MSRIAHLTRRAALPAVPLALASVAEAGVIYTNPGPTTISAGQELFFDLGQSGGGGAAAVNDNLGGAADFSIAFYFGDAAAPVLYRKNSNQLFYTTFSFGFASNFSFGASISDSPTQWSQVRFINYVGTYAGWTPGTTGYVGLRLDAGSGNYNYAWAKITYDLSNNITLHEFAYEQTVNLPITAGAGSPIPEPSTYAVFASLLAGCAAVYRHRQTRSAACALPVG